MRKIFLDGGAHCGCSRKKFKTLHDDYEIFSFEPDPGFNKYCPDLINKALWDKNEIKQYYKFNLAGGSSLLKERVNTMRHLPLSTINVECIDTHDFISQFNKEDYIILKLDVEGSEYTIIPHLLKNHTFEYINEFYIEWHNFRVNVDKCIDEDLENKIKEYDVKFGYWDAMKSGHCIGRDKR